MDEVKNKTNKKGRFSWVITVLELIIVIAYLVIGYSGLLNAFQEMDFAGIFDTVRTAIVFLIIATSIVTFLCFLPAFKSKGNIRWAIWNIIWISFTIYAL